jgi:hypothetical protein
VSKLARGAMNIALIILAVVIVLWRMRRGRKGRVNVTINPPAERIFETGRRAAFGPPRRRRL